MDLNEVETFLNETNLNFNENNENQTSSVIIIMGIGILFTYSLINFILGDPKKILEEIKENDLKEKEIKEKEIREYKKKYYDELSLLENKDYGDEELKQLTNKILKEDTSYGVVHMFYNVDNGTFNYYCDDKNISYIFLDAIARKYAITYDCKCICVNFREEWKKAKKIAYEEQEKKEAREKEGQEKEGQEKNNKKKSIFAQYKSYEKTPRVTNNRKNTKNTKNTKGDNDIDDYDSDDSSGDISGDSKGINKQLVDNKKDKSSIKRRRFNINVKQTNRFTYKGNLKDYKDLEFKNQITKDVTNVKNNLSFKDFKKKLK